MRELLNREGNLLYIHDEQHCSMFNTQYIYILRYVFQAERLPKKKQNWRIKEVDATSVWSARSCLDCSHSKCASPALTNAGKIKLGDPNYDSSGNLAPTPGSLGTSANSSQSVPELLAETIETTAKDAASVAADAL